MHTLPLNTNPFLCACTALAMNLGLRNVVSDLGTMHSMVLSSWPFKWFVVFSMFFMATRDVVVSTVCMFAYLLVFVGLLHERSPLTVWSTQVRDQLERMTTAPSEEAYMAARRVVAAYEAHHHSHS